MSGHLRVKNWTEFQHYKDRNPPWIKLHFALLASEDWVTLDDASKLLAVVCMLVASRNNGMVPNNPAYLKRVAYLDKLPKLKPLIDCGFLENSQADASAVQAPASAPQAIARPETETEAEQKEEPNGSLSETSSDAPSKAGKKQAYTDDFDAFWREYPRTPNMLKTKAFAGWKKLTPEDRQRCHSGVAPYRSFLASKADHPTMHATTFINERRFEGFLEQETPATARPVSEDDWRKRLTYARTNRKWHVEAWGPLPGTDGCRAPSAVLQPEDGQGWAVWEA